jgi:hypothetical protein
MMSKATRKLVLKKELLRTLDERHLTVVNGGGDWHVSGGLECSPSEPILCEFHPVAVKALR